MLASVCRSLCLVDLHRRVYVALVYLRRVHQRPLHAATGAPRHERTTRQDSTQAQGGAQAHGGRESTRKNARIQLTTSSDVHGLAGPLLRPRIVRYEPTRVSVGCSVLRCTLFFCSKRIKLFQNNTIFNSIMLSFAICGVRMRFTCMRTVDVTTRLSLHACPHKI